jgi:hypothetical protein
VLHTQPVGASYALCLLPPLHLSAVAPPV